MAQCRKRTMEFVQNDKARLATFQRRSHCLLKKASELSTLCDVDVAVLIYADHLSDRPLVFPPESGESLRIIKKFKENPRSVPAAKSKSDQLLNQENHIKRPNDRFCDDIMSLNLDELNSLVRKLDAKEEEVLKKINAIGQRKNEAAVDEVPDPNRSLFRSDDHHSDSFDHQPLGLQWPISFSVMGNEHTAKSKSEQLTETNSGFLNQISEHLNNNNYNDEITSLNVGEAPVEEISDPNCFFSGDDRQSALFDHQQHGFQWPIYFSVMGNEDTAKSKSDQLPEINSGFPNQIFRNLNNNNYNDEITSLNVGEAAVEEIANSNCFFFSGDDHQSVLFNHQQHGFQWPISFSFMGKDNTPESKSEHLTEKNSGLCNLITGNPDNIYYDELMSLDVGELDSLSQILDAMKEDEIDTIGEKSNQMPNCWNFPESFYDKFSDPNCLFFGGDGRPTPSVSEITTGLEFEFFDRELHDFQTASSSAAMVIPYSYKVEDDTPISEPRHLIENNFGLLDSVVPILDVEPEEAKDESNIIIETTDCDSFSESSDFESLAAIFCDELPGENSFSLNSENAMYHQYESLDYQPFGFQRLNPFS